MAGYVNASWEIPPLEALNISDCDAIGPWIAYYFTEVAGLSPEIKSESWISDVQTKLPIRVALKFLRSLVPNNWTTPTDGELLAWQMEFIPYMYADGGDTFMDIGMYALYECSGSTICPNLDFSGDSDLSGIGMIISFYMVAIFVTLFYLALVPGVFETYGRESKSSKIVSLYRKVASGFEESVAGFLDAMLLFAISMLVAALTRYADAIIHPNESHSLFGLQDCVFLSAYSILATLVLQSLSYDLRRQRIRMALWALLIALTITLEVFYRREYIDFFDRIRKNGVSPDILSQDGQLLWYISCQSEQLRAILQTLLTVGHWIMGINTVAGIYLMAETFLGDRWIPKLQCRARLWNIWATCKMWLRLANGLVCLTTMWAFLGLFTAYRKDVMTKAGEADQDGEWTFGQVLSLTTWVPIGIELLSVYHYGVRKGVEGKLSRRYTVIERTDTRVQDSVIYEKTPAVETTPMDDVMR
ncbi:hypothetical protein VPNG_09751 [Cytospora leucostoma]|uniref:Uncharacterized protein n=1 Tax=Cytospora leucostoma TaxID=1230097 RepID=A0A423VLM1_9PEZI|nr:hypothetical protein VPNG_09751 [Cytospora leucostoma]